MRSVMPSQAVAVIDQLFPHAKQGVGDGKIDPSQSTKLRGLLDIVDAIPEELLSCPAPAYADFVLAKSTIRQTLAQWETRGTIGAMAPSGGADAVVTLRRVLVILPDEAPPVAHADLAFINDEALRASIRVDIGSAHRSHERAEWKSATVMAGAAIEALLHWRLHQEPQSTLDGTARAPTRGGMKKPLNDYVLHDYIEVAEDLGILPTKTATAARLAKDYRNLIHPGRAVRLSEQCTRGTSLMAIGAMEAIIEALL